MYNWQHKGLRIVVPNIFVSFLHDLPWRSISRWQSFSGNRQSSTTCDQFNIVGKVISLRVPYYSYLRYGHRVRLFTPLPTFYLELVLRVCRYVNTKRFAKLWFSSLNLITQDYGYGISICAAFFLGQSAYMIAIQFVHQPAYLRIGRPNSKWVWGQLCAQISDGALPHKTLLYWEMRMKSKPSLDV